MRTVGKDPIQRASKNVKSNNRHKAATAIKPGPQSSQTAAYIAEMCGSLSVMAKHADLALLAHLLAMAQAEAHYAAEQPDEPGSALTKEPLDQNKTNDEQNHELPVSAHHEGMTPWLGRATVR